MQKHCRISSSIICFGNLLESPQRGDSNKYPKHMLYEEIRLKQGLSYISFCPLRILHNSKFIIMATFIWNKCCLCNEGSLYEQYTFNDMSPVNENKNLRNMYGHRRPRSDYAEAQSDWDLPVRYQNHLAL